MYLIGEVRKGLADPPAQVTPADVTAADRALAKCDWMAEAASWRSRTGRRMDTARQVAAALADREVSALTVKEVVGMVADDRVMKQPRFVLEAHSNNNN